MHGPNYCISSEIAGVRSCIEMIHRTPDWFDKHVVASQTPPLQTRDSGNHLAPPCMYQPMPLPHAPQMRAGIIITHNMPACYHICRPHMHVSIFTLRDWRYKERIIIPNVSEGIENQTE